MIRPPQQLSEQAMARAIEMVLDAIRDAGTETVGDGVACLAEAMARVLAVAPHREREAMIASLMAALPKLIRRAGARVERLRALRDATPGGTA